MRSARPRGRGDARRHRGGPVRREPPAQLHAVALAGTFIAPGGIVLATIQILGVVFAGYNPNAALPIIYITIGIAIAMVTLAGLSRVRA